MLFIHWQQWRWGVGDGSVGVEGYWKKIKQKKQNKHWSAYIFIVRLFPLSRDKFGAESPGTEGGESQNLRQNGKAAKKGDQASLTVSLPGLWCAGRQWWRGQKRELWGREGRHCGLGICSRSWGGFISCQRGAALPANWLWRWKVGEVSERSREAEWRDISQGSLHSFLPEFPSASPAFISSYSALAIVTSDPLQCRSKITNLRNEFPFKRFRLKLSL